MAKQPADFMESSTFPNTRAVLGPQPVEQKTGYTPPQPSSVTPVNTVSTQNSSPDGKEGLITPKV